MDRICTATGHCAGMGAHHTTALAWVPPRLYELSLLYRLVLWHLMLKDQGLSWQDPCWAECSGWCCTGKTHAGQGAATHCHADPHIHIQTPHQEDSHASHLVGRLALDAPHARHPIPTKIIMHIHLLVRGLRYWKCVL